LVDKLLKSVSQHSTQLFYSDDRNMSMNHSSYGIVVRNQIFRNDKSHFMANRLYHTPCGQHSVRRQTLDEVWLVAGIQVCCLLSCNQPHSSTIYGAVAAIIFLLLLLWQ